MTENDEIMRQALEELREAAEELSDEDLHTLTLFALLARGGAVEPTGIFVDDEELMAADSRLQADRPAEEHRFWNAVMMVLVADRDRRKPLSPPES